MSPEELAAIRERADVPGTPWESFGTGVNTMWTGAHDWSGPVDDRTPVVLDCDPRVSEFIAHAPTDIAALLAEVERLTERLRAEESSHGDTIDQRDEAQEWADKLAYSIAPMEVIGEHSSGNNPWQNALDAPNPLQARLDAVRALAEEWRYKGEFGWGAWQEGEGPDIEGQILDGASSVLRRTLDGSEATEARRVPKLSALRDHRPNPIPLEGMPLMSDAEKIAEVLAAHRKEMGHRDLRVHCMCGWSSRELPTYVQYAAHVAAALEPVIRGREKAAWERGVLDSTTGATKFTNPYDTKEEA